MDLLNPQLTIEHVKALAAQMGVTFTDNGQSFDLDKQEPLRLEGTYRNTQTGIDSAYGSLVRHQTSLSKLSAHKR